MNRNKYSKEFEQTMINIAKYCTLNELLNYASKKYKYNITKAQLRQYLSKRKIRYKDYNSLKSRLMGYNFPIGTEYVKSDGMTLVKVEKDKWMYKQRKIYEDYYNIKLKSDEFVIFLDQNRKNFDIKNLKVISRRESAILSNQKIFSKNPKATNLGVTIAKLIIKKNDIEKKGR